ncbi:MAG: dephospho-CoA kinase [Woeseiaceae bacterium]
MNRPLRIGLTGGIASGKSTVADHFAELGVPVIDTDVIAREVVQPGKPALEEIRSAFGIDVFDSDGRLNRRSMRELVFSDATRRAQLESILHPRIREETVAQSRAAGGPYQIIVVPLLVESPMREFVDRVLVVDCDENTQLKRLLERDADDEDQARRMIAAQASRDERLAIADDVISNNGDLDDTRSQVDALHKKYLSQNTVICPE